MLFPLCLNFIVLKLKTAYTLTKFVMQPTLHLHRFCGFKKYVQWRPLIWKHQDFYIVNCLAL
jgi:hypothetical protein